MYSGYGIAFDVVRSWSFDNDFAKSVINFDVDNSSSSHTDNWKKDFLVLGEGPTSSINITKARTKIFLSLHYSSDNSYLLVNWIEIYDIKVGLSHLVKKIIVCVTESSLKMMKNSFYFILKLFSFSRYSNFCSWLFGHIEKTAWLER